MTDEKGYQCGECEQTQVVRDDSVPECCGKPMLEVPLDFCSKPPSDPESARFDDSDDACDDSRG